MKYLDKEEERLYMDCQQRLKLIHRWFELIDHNLSTYEKQAFKDIMEGLTKLKDENNKI